MLKIFHPKEADGLSDSSRFNLKFMRRTNMLAIIMFLAGILYKAIDMFFFR